MKTKLLLAFFAAMIVLISLGIKLTQKASGGEKKFEQVVTVLKTNPYIGTALGAPFTLQHNGGPYEVIVGKMNLRRGFYSVDLIGPRGREALKVYWHQSAANVTEIDEIYRSKPFTQDELLWAGKK